jgi:hypothetical protein
MAAAFGVLVTNDWQLAPARMLALYRSKSLP